MDALAHNPETIIQRLRLAVHEGKKQLRITTHAQVEAAKDGLLLTDLRHIFEQGRIIEFYSERQRFLLYEHTLNDQIPVHIVIEDTPDAGVIITAYVPDKRIWIANMKRRRPK